MDCGWTGTWTRALMLRTPNPAWHVASSAFNARDAAVYLNLGLHSWASKPSRVPVGWAWGLEAQLVRPRPPSCAEKSGHCPQGRGTQLANIIVISGAEGEPRISSEDNSSGPDILSLRGDGGNRYPPTKTRLKKKVNGAFPAVLSNYSF